MLNFGQKVEEKSSDIIPKDSLLWAVLAIREIKNSQETQGRYLDIELTICDGIPYARRKIWVMIADPFDNRNSEEWRTMGYGAIRRILEAVRGASPDNANSYALNQLQDLHGLTVPIITTIEKGRNGYDDRNKADFLSPHSSIKKVVECFNLLKQGVFEYAKAKKPGAPAQPSMFNGTQAAAPAQMPQQNFNPPAAAAPAGNAPGWLAPNAGQAPAPGFTPGQAPAQHTQPAPQTTGYAPPTINQSPAQPAPTAQTTSPSNGWQPPAGGGPAQFPQ